MTGITVQIDGERRELQIGARLKDLLPDSAQETSIGIIYPATRESLRTSRYRLQTTSGEIAVDSIGQVPEILESPDIPRPVVLHWHDRYAAAFGPFASTIVPARRPHLYDRGDLVLGCGGYDPKRSYLIFSKLRHYADYGAPADGGIVGKVVSGKGVLDRWSTGSALSAIEPVISWADMSRSFTTKDRELLLEDGMDIVTRVKVDALGYTSERILTDSAASVEHLLLTLQDGGFVVGRSSSTHIRDERKIETDVPEEVQKARLEGTVTVRTRGQSRGSIYIYTSDLPRIMSHTVVGQVTQGLELVRLAREGDVFSIMIAPERFDLIGEPLEKAFEMARMRQIRVASEQTGSNLVVIDQVPQTTLECLAAGEVSLTTLPLDRIIDITLDDMHAPNSCDIFRHLTGLHIHHIGRMPFFFNFDDVYLFKPSIPKGVKIIPENNPLESAPAAALAITNDSRKGSGLVGVRLTENREFGPTSEPFEGTNIIGRVIDVGKLSQCKEKEIVFIREVRSG